MNIGYYTEPEEAYARAIRAASSQQDLCDAIEPYLLIAWDAYDAACKITDWQDWTTGLKRERAGKFSGEDWVQQYGAIVMPEIMMRVSIVAHQFKAPWGTAYIRLQETGRIVERDGHATWKG